MGTVSGSFVLAERGGGGGGGAGEVGSSRTLVAQRTELEAKSREISELRAQLGLPRGAAAKELASTSASCFHVTWLPPHGPPGWRPTLPG